MDEDSVARLTLNRRLLICWRTPKKLALSIVLSMAVLGTLVLETENPGDIAELEAYRALPPVTAGITNPRANCL